MQLLLCIWKRKFYLFIYVLYVCIVCVFLCVSYSTEIRWWWRWTRWLG